MSRRKQPRPQHLWSGESDDENQETSETPDRQNEEPSQQPYTQPYTKQPTNQHTNQGRLSDNNSEQNCHSSDDISDTQNTISDNYTNHNSQSHVTNHRNKEGTIIGDTKHFTLSEHSEYDDIQRTYLSDASTRSDHLDDNKTKQVSPSDNWKTLSDNTRNSEEILNNNYQSERGSINTTQVSASDNWRKRGSNFLLNERTGELHAGASRKDIGDYPQPSPACLSTSLVCDKAIEDCYPPVFTPSSSTTTATSSSLFPVISSLSIQTSNTKQPKTCDSDDVVEILSVTHSREQPVNTSPRAYNPAEKARLYSADFSDKRYLSTRLREKSEQLVDSNSTGHYSELNDKRYLGAKLREKNEIFRRIRRHSAALSEGYQVQPQRFRTQSESTALHNSTEATTHNHSTRSANHSTESINSLLTRNKSTESLNSLSDLSLSINTSGLLYPSASQITSPLGSFPWLRSVTPTIQGLSPNQGEGAWPRYTCQVCGVVLRSLGELGMHIQEHAGEKLYKCELCEGSFETRQILAEHEIHDHHIKPRDNEQRKRHNNNNMQPQHTDKARFNFHSPWEEFTPRRRSESALPNKSHDDHMTADRTSHEQHVAADRVSHDHHVTREHRLSPRRISHDHHMTETKFENTGQNKSSKHWNGGQIDSEHKPNDKTSKPNGNYEIIDTPRSRSSSEVDLNKSYRSTLSLDSSIGSDRLNSSGEASYHSLQHSPLTSPTTPADRLYSPGYSDHRPPSSSSYGAEPAGGGSSKGHNGIPSEKDALNSLKNLTAKNFAAFPSLPGFANAFGQHPWAAMTKYGQVNGLIPAVVGSGRSAMMVGSYNQPSTSSSGGKAGTSLPFRGTLGKHTDSGLACSYCGKVCPRPSILKRHMMMHTGERPFECKVCGQRFRAKGSMLFHQKLRHNMDVKLNKALEERYLQIVANQKQKQMREERKKAALTSKDSTAWFQHEMQSWMLQSHLQSRMYAGNTSASHTASTASHLNESLGSPPPKLEVSAISDGCYDDDDDNGEVGEISGKSPERDYLMESDSVVVKKEESEAPVVSDVNGNITSRHTESNNNNDVNSKTNASQSDLDRGQREGDFTQKLTISPTGELSAENLNRIRDMMFTPDPPQSLPGFDDNCNLKENLDRLIMKAFSKLGIESCNMSPTDGNGREGHTSSQGTSANSSISISPDSNTLGGSRGGEGAERVNFNIEYPSVFPGLKHQMNIRNETVIVTRLDGINTNTGQKVSLYKCYLCGRIFHQLSLLQCHLSTHFDKYMTFYECLYCDAHFKFKAQLLQHMNSAHDLNYALSDIPDTAMETTEPTPLDEPSQENITSPDPQGQSDLLDSTPLSHKGKFHSGITLKKVNGLYVCRFCNKSFERLFSVIRHERMHTGYKPCICRHCGRGFSEPRNLRQHMARFHDPLTRRSPSGKMLRPKRRNSSNMEGESKRLSPLESTNYIFTQGNRDDLSTAPPSDQHIGEQGKTEEDERTESPENESGISEISSSRLDSSNEMANEIREKERLGDDVTVVIPSDAPLDSRERSVDTPRSINSENTTWSNISEVEGDVTGEIVSAPLRSIIGPHHYKLPRRRPSYPGGGVGGDVYPGGEGGGYPSSNEGTITPITVTPQTDDPQMDEEPLHVTNERSPEAVDFKPPTFMTAEAATTTAVTATSTPQGATPSGMFGPLSVSTFLNPAGLPGLIPSPLMSPAQQAAFFAQAGLTSPTVMGGVLPFMSPFHTPGGALGGASSSSSKDPSPTTTEPSPGYSAKMDELRGDYISQLGKGSSLSRTHSRNPIKREEACKPTVLSDGRTVYRCSYCNKDFATYSDINRHMDFHEGKTDIRPYKCKYCDYYARTNSQLKVHMMRHQGIREFHCKLCNYKGVTQSDLNRHMKSQIHMMKAQNECRHCGEGFVSPKNLERHNEEKHYHQSGHDGASRPSHGHHEGANRPSPSHLSHEGGANRPSPSHHSHDGATRPSASHHMVGFQAPLPR